jgi:hypothetical protein
MPLIELTGQLLPLPLITILATAHMDTDFTIGLILIHVIAHLVNPLLSLSNPIQPRQQQHPQNRNLSTRKASAHDTVALGVVAFMSSICLCMGMRTLFVNIMKQTQFTISVIIV